MSKRKIIQRAVNNKYKCSFLQIKYDSFGFYLAPKVCKWFHSNCSKLTKEQIMFHPYLLNKVTKVIIDRIPKANGIHTISAIR